MTPSQTQTPAGPPRGRLGTAVTALLVALAVGCYAGWGAWREDRGRTVPMDVDGWGVKAERLKAGAGPGTLFTDPSLWKGPVVPFVFGAAYLVAPFYGSVLAFNVLAFALAAGCFVLAFCSFGAPRWLAALAVLLGACYWPHHYVFGYYYAEPVLALLLAALLLLLRWATASDRLAAPLLAGAVAGVLLLARAPFFFAVAAVPALLWYHTPWGQRRAARAGAFVLGLLVAFVPWGARNYLAYHELIPFTTEGGKILFQGTYLRGDSVTINEIRQIPEYAALEKNEGAGAVEQYRYWRALALEQVRRDPLGQLRLCVRKALRFWVYLPQHSWVPTWKTALVAAFCLPLALAGSVLGRRSFLVQVCALWVGGLWAFHALVHAELRYNYPVLPLAFLLALLGARGLFARLRREAALPAPAPRPAGRGAALAVAK